MKSIEIYDPAMCCASGVCGPAPDESLASFAAALEKAKAAGLAVRRRNLSQEPLAIDAFRRIRDQIQQVFEAYAAGLVEAEPA